MKKKKQVKQKQEQFCALSQKIQIFLCNFFMCVLSSRRILRDYGRLEKNLHTKFDTNTCASHAHNSTICSNKANVSQTVRMRDKWERLFECVSERWPLNIFFVDYLLYCALREWNENERIAIRCNLKRKKCVTYAWVVDYFFDLKIWREFFIMWVKKNVSKILGNKNVVFLVTFN